MIFFLPKKQISFAKTGIGIVMMMLTIGLRGYRTVDMTDEMCKNSQSSLDWNLIAFESEDHLKIFLYSRIPTLFAIGKDD